MRYFQSFFIAIIFILMIPLFAASESSQEGSPPASRTKQEFMHAWLDDAGAVEGVPVIAPFKDWDYYYLYKSISWTPKLEHQGKYKTVRVPSGFVTDLASIPKVFWSILPATERYTFPAIIHDYLYWTQPVSRDVADQILKISMEELKVDSVKVAAIYNAVKMFGESAWKENIELKAKGEKRLLKKFPEDPQITWEEWKQRKDVFTD